MPRLAPFLVAAALMASLVACGDDESEVAPSATLTATPSPSPSATVEPTETVSPTTVFHPRQLGTILEPVDAPAEDGYYVLELATRKIWRSEVPISDWSPDSTRLLSINCCIGGGGLDVINVTTGKAVRLIEGDLSGVAWAPDGEAIAFSPYGPTEDGLFGVSGIYLMGSEGGTIRPVSPGGGGPVWSSDGRYLAYVMQNHLYVWDSELDTAHRVTEEIGAAYYVAGPIWSPTEPVLIFGGDYRSNDAGPAKTPLYLYNASSREVTQLFTNDARTSVHWSPDGRRLLVAQGDPLRSDDASGFTHVPYRVLDVPSGILGDALPAGRFPAWSPDGSRIAFIGEGCLTGDWDVFVIDPDGSNQVRVTNTPDSVKEGLTWTADGEALIYGGGDGLRRVSIETGEIEVLVPGLLHYHGDMSPDGRYLLFSNVGGHGVCT